MKRRNQNRSRTTTADSRLGFFSIGYFLVAILAALVLAAGLFFAASQHFSSMELGIRNAKLRSQLAELENEKRRLELSREIALTPAELKRTARSLGFRDAAEFVTVAAKQETEGSVTDSVVEVVKVKATNGLLETVSTSPVPSSKPGIRIAGEVRPLKVASRPTTKELKASTTDSRPRVVVASAHAPQSDARKLIKKTVSSDPTNRSTNKLR
jgi:hypothetical protein